MMMHDVPPDDPRQRPRYAGRWIMMAIACTALYFAGMGVHERMQRTERRLNDARLLYGGDPANGPALMRRNGCAGCHTIDGVDGADGLVGPPLTGITKRMYVAGVLTNTPTNLVRWIMNPKAIDPKTAMPVVGVSEREARDIAAYLYTLQ